MKTRTESDSVGNLEVPAEAYYGVPEKVEKQVMESFDGYEEMQEVIKLRRIKLQRNEEKYDDLQEL